MTRVMFQGIAGAYSEAAIHHFFGPQVTSVPCASFAEMFTVVEASATTPVEQGNGTTANGSRNQGGRQ